MLSASFQATQLSSYTLVYHWFVSESIITGSAKIHTEGKENNISYSSLTHWETFLHRKLSDWLSMTFHSQNHAE